VIIAEGQEAQANLDGSGSSEKRERRSRDRYGRDRRERASEPRQETPGEEAQADLNADPSSAPVAEVTGEDRPATRSYFERAQQAAATPAAQEVHAPIGEAPLEAPLASNLTAAASVAPAAEPMPAPAAAAVATVAAAAPAAPAAPAVATRAALPSAASYYLQIDSLQQVAQDSGLVWVNSDADKVATVQAAIAAEIKPARVPRERPPAVVLNEGPLVLVETRKDLKDMNLPF
jgi:ribonuclease E